MSCNSQIHDELKNMMESTCPFCDEQLVKVNEVVEPCCTEQDMETVNGMNTCMNCGLVHGYVFANEYIDIHENLYKIVQKSVYHVDNVLNDICYCNGVELTHHQRNKIHKVFADIKSIISLVNKNWKRMIATKFIIMLLFILLGIPSESIEITKSKKILKFYNQYWEKIKLLRFDKIISILRQ